MSVGDLRIERAGAGMLAAKSASVGAGGFVGLAITPRLVVEPGGRVLAGPRHVAVLAIVAAAAASLAVLLTRLVSARRPAEGGGVQ